MQKIIFDFFFPLNSNHDRTLSLDLTCVIALQLQLIKKILFFELSSPLPLFHFNIFICPNLTTPLNVFTPYVMAFASNSGMSVNSILPFLILNCRSKTYEGHGKGFHKYLGSDVEKNFLNFQCQLPDLIFTIHFMFFSIELH